MGFLTSYLPTNHFLMQKKTDENIDLSWTFPHAVVHSPGCVGKSKYDFSPWALMVFLENNLCLTY